MMMKDDDVYCNNLNVEERTLCSFGYHHNVPQRPELDEASHFT